jgi:hypothetical protein
MLTVRIIGDWGETGSGPGLPRSGLPKLKNNFKKTRTAKRPVPRGCVGTQMRHCSLIMNKAKKNYFL